MERASEWFEGRRNELIGLIGEAKSLEIPAEYADELNAVAKKCRENAFEIALVGEFQGGKSTTFDALCDGRDISPRGCGIKTSAAAVSVQNIADGAMKDGLTEWAEISFRAPSAIKLGMSSLLGKYCATDEAFRRSVGAGESFDFMSQVDLDKESHRNALMRVVDATWDNWAANKLRWNDEDLDQLRIATLQIRNYQTAAFKEMVSKKVVPVMEFQRLVAFPTDWSIRWSQGKAAQFALEEIAFVFIESVLVRIHSKNLERLGCRVTDCPGLFANAYDTSVAKTVISGSDCVWYLINGERVIGQKDKEIIGQVYSMGMQDKIAATCNLKGEHEQKLAEILPSTRTELTNSGYNVEVYPYNARLAFLAMQGDMVLNRPEQISDTDLANMRKDAKVKTGDPAPAEMWTKMIRRMGTQTGLEDLEEVEDLDAESLSLVRRESYLDEIIERLSKDAVAKKARSLLVDKGSVRAVKALQKYEGNLQVAEDAAAADVAEWQQKMNEAKAALDEFVRKALTVVERSSLKDGLDALSWGMSHEFVTKALSGKFREDLSMEICLVIAKHEGEFSWSRDDFKQEVIEDVKPRVLECFHSAVLRTAEVFKIDGESDSIVQLKKRCQMLSEDIHDLWKDRHLDVNEFFNGFPLPEVPQNIAELVCEEIVTGSFGDGVLADAVEDARMGVFGAIWKAFKCLVSLIPDLIGRIWDWFFDLAHEEESQEARQKRLAKDFYPKVLPGVVSAFDNLKTLEAMEKPLTAKFASAQKKIIDDFVKALNGLAGDFEKTRCKPVEENFTKSQEERKRIADENRQIRTGKIVPLREKIQRFESAVLTELAS